jgi:carboxy-terminal domain RNA polymerase II polypeptide A small phosphatase
MVKAGPLQVALVSLVEHVLVWLQALQVAFVSLVTSDDPGPKVELATHVGILCMSWLAGWYAQHSVSQPLDLLERAKSVGGWLFGVWRLVTFRPSKLALPANAVQARLLQCLADTDSDEVVLKELRASKEWKAFIEAAEQQREKKQVLVLDLDETLIHSSPERKSLCQPAFMLLDEDQRQHYYVYKRPFVDVFLKFLAPIYKVVVYTASFPSYSDPILDTIDPPPSSISRCLSNNMLVETKLYGMQKDLTLVSKEHMPNRLIMVDNSSIACMANQENLFVINSFRAHQPYDKELLSLLLLFVNMRDMQDVRAVLHRRVTMAPQEG